VFMIFLAHLPLFSHTSLLWGSKGWDNSRSDQSVLKQICYNLLHAFIS